MPQHVLEKTSRFNGSKGRTEFEDQTTTAYNRFNKVYLEYADGPDPLKDLLSFRGRQFAYADETVWSALVPLIERQLSRQPKVIRILDVGCGPGTWMFRIAHEFANRGREVHITGVDCSEGLIKLANEQKELFFRTHSNNTLKIDFESGVDLGRKLPFDDNAFDLTCCLFTVLNHVPVSRLPMAAKELLRVSSDTVYGNVRSKFGLPTAYVCPLEDVASWVQSGDWLHISHRNNEEYAIRSHLFDSSELEHLFRSATEKRLRGIDVVFSRMRQSMFAHGLADPPSLSVIKEKDVEMSTDSSLLNYANHISFSCWV